MALFWFKVLNFKRLFDLLFQEFEEDNNLISSWLALHLCYFNFKGLAIEFTNSCKFLRFVTFRIAYQIDYNFANRPFLHLKIGCVSVHKYFLVLKVYVHCLFSEEILTLWVDSHYFNVDWLFRTYLTKNLLSFFNSSKARRFINLAHNNAYSVVTYVNCWLINDADWGARQWEFFTYRLLISCSIVNLSSKIHEWTVVIVLSFFVFGCFMLFCFFVVNI